MGTDGPCDLPYRCLRDTPFSWSSTTRHFYSNNHEYSYRAICLLVVQLCWKINYCCHLLSPSGMSLEEVLAEFQQLRRGRGQGERALLGQNVLVPSLGDAAALGVDCPAGPSSLELLPSPPLCGVELGAELELAGLCPSSPDWQLRGLAVQVEAARLSQDDQLQRRSAKLEKIKVKVWWRGGGQCNVYGNM